MNLIKRLAALIGYPLTYIIPLVNKKENQEFRNEFKRRILGK